MGITKKAAALCLARVNLSRFAAIRTLWMLSDDIAVIGANREAWRKGKVRQFVILTNRFDQFLQRLRIIHTLAQEEVNHRTARVFGLQIILQIHQLKQVISVVDWQVAGIGVERMLDRRAQTIGKVCSIREAGFVNLSQTVGCTLSRRCFQIVIIASF